MKSKKALIFSAPSGAGKTTVVNHLMETFPRLDFSITATTRPSRELKNGREYYFISKDEFQKLIKEDAFVEWEEVYKDVFTVRSNWNWNGYGTETK